MKKTIVVLVMVALCATIFASVSIGANVVLGAPFSTLSSYIEEENYEAIKEEAFKNSEITAKLEVDVLCLNLGIEGGVWVQDEKTIPIIKAFGGIKTTVLGFIEIGGGAGYRFAFTQDDNYERDLYWRLSGGVKLGSLSLEGVATLPVGLKNEKDLESSFNFGSNLGSVQLGIGLGIQIK